MTLIAELNTRLRRCSIFDIKLAQIASICGALIVVKYVPEILTISVWWFVAVLVLSAIRPFYVFFAKRG